MSLDAARLADALGASRTVSLPSRPLGGPLDMLHLRALVASIRSAPTALAHPVGLPDSSWQQLVALAAEMRAEGHDVTPEELARLMIERELEALRESRKKTG